MVTEAGRVAGLVTPREVKATERSRWPETRLSEVMRPLEKVHSIALETPAVEAVELMAREDLNQIPVIADHHVEGMITRARILQMLRARMEWSSR
jgi:CBS domain-containing protein